MMRKLILATVVAFMAIGGHAQDKTFTVTGSCEGLGDSALVVLISPQTQKPVGQELLATAGDKVNYEVALDDAAILYVASITNGQPDYRVMMSLPAIPGETLHLSGNGTNPVLGGSPFYADYNAALQAIGPQRQAATDFISNLQTQASMGMPQDQVMAKYEQEFPALSKALSDAIIAYVKAHSDQPASAALLAELDDDIDAMTAGEALLSEQVRNSAAAGLYKGVMAAAKREREEEARQEGMVNSPAPDFTLNDINGQPLALSSLRGKWVVIDFWGSWCGWCIKGIPAMKEYYAKYRDKMEILGVDCNDTVEKWKAAVAKHEMPWLHVYCDMSNMEQNPLALYGVKGFPTKVVVNPEGIVARVVVGEDPAFYEYLDSVLR